MKLWTLFYGSQPILIKQPYPVCKAKEKQLKQSNNYKLQTFKIKYAS